MNSRQKRQQVAARRQKHGTFWVGDPTWEPYKGPDGQVTTTFSCTLRDDLDPELHRQFAAQDIAERKMWWIERMTYTAIVLAVIGACVFFLWLVHKDKSERTVKREQITVDAAVPLQGRTASLQPKPGAGSR